MGPLQHVLTTFLDAQDVYERKHSELEQCKKHPPLFSGPYREYGAKKLIDADAALSLVSRQGEWASELENLEHSIVELKESFEIAEQAVLKLLPESYVVEVYARNAWYYLEKMPGKPPKLNYKKVNG